jgi:hypothetical protein
VLGGDTKAADSLRSRSALVAFRLLFHLFESCVVVGELVQVGKCDLSGDQRIVVGHVREDVAEAVLELDVHEIVEAELRQRGPLERGVEAAAEAPVVHVAAELVNEHKIIVVGEPCPATEAVKRPSRLIDQRHTSHAP